MKKKILIVDDEENIVISLSFLLKQEGYIIETAQNGKAAIEQFEQFQPDIILLDVMMPVMDGFEAAQHIRKIATKELHIVFLTAKGTVQDKLDGYKSGAEYYIVKPFDNEELLTLLKEIN